MLNSDHQLFTCNHQNHQRKLFQSYKTSSLTTHPAFESSSKVASKKLHVSGKKMDTIVPSPNLINTPFAPSPHSLSIYEQEKKNTFWADAKVKNVDMSSLTDDCDPLDDQFEDSSLKNYFTPEFFNSAGSSSSIGASFSLQNKCNLTESQEPSAESSFNQLGFDSFISDLFLNIDSNDSRLSSSAFDFEIKSLSSNPSSSCQTPVPSDPKSYLTDLSTARDNSLLCSKEGLTKESIGADFLNKKFPMKTNFPPRKSQPPIGVVSPVKIKDDNGGFDHFTNIKVEMKDSKGCESKIDLTELPPQTVPSYGVTIQDGYPVNMKIEPTSPEYNKRKAHLKRSSHDDLEGLNFNKTKRKRYDSGSSGHLSDEGEEEDHEDNIDYDSDDDNSDLDADLAHMKPGGCESLLGPGKKQKQYFWQYNVQAKGPKGTRLKLAVEAPTDPHVLNGFEDPVFDEGNTMLAGIRHGGKARKGDGNEVTPNPQKLFRIGHQLLRLNRKINACQLGSDIPLEKRNESRKEKNKLASRACRLKKKAQHEANKIKLNGLETEHTQINNVLRLIWPELREKAKKLQSQQVADEKPSTEINSLTSKLTDYISSNLKSMVAGNTTDYVNNVILAVEKGDVSGGLSVKTRKT